MQLIIECSKGNKTSTPNSECQSKNCCALPLSCFSQICFAQFGCKQQLRCHLGEENSALGAQLFRFITVGTEQSKPLILSHPILRVALSPVNMAANAFAVIHDSSVLKLCRYFQDGAPKLTAMSMPLLSFVVMFRRRWLITGCEAMQCDPIGYEFWCLSPFCHQEFYWPRDSLSTSLSLSLTSSLFASSLLHDINACNSLNEEHSTSRCPASRCR